MKTRTLIMALTILSVLSIRSNAEELTIDTKIDRVTVYSEQALVVRQGTIDLTKGEHTLVIKGLPSTVQEKSLRASASSGGGAMILGLTHEKEYHTDASPENVRDIDLKINNLQNNELQLIEDRIITFTQQKQLVETLIKSVGKEQGDLAMETRFDVKQWDAAFQFVGNRMLEAFDSLRSVQTERKRLHAELKRLKSERNSIASKTTTETKTVQVKVKLNNDSKLTLSLEYRLPGASWSALYDARMNIESDSLTLTYFAEITQKTGEDWNDAKLTLSTEQLALASGPGRLRSWHVAAVLVTAGVEVLVRGGRADEVSYIVDGISFGDPGFTPGMLVSGHMKGVPLSDPLGGVVDATPLAGPFPGFCNFTASFEILRRESITSGSKAVRTTIGEYSLGVETLLLARPSNRETVYRMATVTNQKDAPLMPGNVSLFAGSGYLGETRFANTVVPGQEFKLSFGQYRSVSVEREIVDFKRSSRGNKSRIDRTIRIKLHNISSRVQNIDIEEPIPVSQNDKIKIKVRFSKPKPETDEDRKSARWKLTIAPGEEIELKIPIRIDYPSGWEIRGL